MITFDGVEEQTHRTDTDYMYMLITSSNRHRRSVAQMHTPTCLNANFSLCVFCLLHTGHGKKIGKKNWRSNKLCFLPFAHRTRRRQCAAALRGCASFRCFPHPFSLVFIIFLLTDQRQGRQCAGAVCVCLCTDGRHGRQVVGYTWRPCWQHNTLTVGNTTHLLTRDTVANVLELGADASRHKWHTRSQKRLR